MEFLSLEREPEPRGPRVSRTEAILASLAIHALILLILLWLPDHLPESLRRWVEARPIVVAQRDLAGSPGEVLTQPKMPAKKAPRIPLKFAYVKVPNDVASAPNPQAHLMSDKNRRARQEMPTPPDARQFTSDPHSVGDSRDRVKPDPRIAQGPDMPKPPEPPAPKAPEKPIVGTGGPADGPGSAAAALSSAGATPEAKGGPAGDSRSPAADGFQKIASGSAGGGARTSAGAAGTSGGPAGAPPRSPTDSSQGTEYKFNFNNQGWLRGGAYGTLSFDTQGFPWGDYARQLYVIIRNNWLPRLPLAYREGLAGFSCQHFVIAKDGTITSIDITRSSSIPPFNHAATDALRASSPLPPLPEDFPNPQEGVTGCFYYNTYPEESD